VPSQAGEVLWLGVGGDAGFAEAEAVLTSSVVVEGGAAVPYAQGFSQRQGEGVVVGGEDEGLYESTKAEFPSELNQRAAS